MTGPYYHGTIADLPVGTILVPRGERAEARGDRYVHFTTDFDTALVFARRILKDGGVGHIYEVEPIGTPERWRFNEFSFRAPKARVIREVPLPKTAKVAGFNAGDMILLDLTEDRLAHGVLKEWGTDKVTFTDGRSFEQDEIRMAFQSNPSKRAASAKPRLYHGTPHALPIGTVLVPGGPDGDLIHGGANVGKWVWLTESPADALSWAEHYTDEGYVQGHAYEVDAPEARTTRGFHTEPGEPIGGPGLWVAPSATIIHEVGPRGGRKKASRTSIWRGVGIELRDEDHRAWVIALAQGDRAKMADILIDAFLAMEATNNRGAGGYTGTGFGIHWTTDRKVAERYGGVGNPNPIRYGGTSCFVPILMEAELDSDTVETDEAVLIETGVNGYGWPGEYGSESEVTIRRAAEVKLKQMIVHVPKDHGDPLDLYDRAKGDIRYPDPRWDPNNPDHRPTVADYPWERMSLPVGGRTITAAKTAAPINGQRTPGGRSYAHSITGKNGKTYYIAAASYYDAIEAFTEQSEARRTVVGRMVVWEWRGRREIHNIEVKEAHRRQGIATAMLALSREGYPDLVHAGPGQLSNDGKAWAEKVGAMSDVDTPVDDAAIRSSRWYHATQGDMPFGKNWKESAKSFVEDHYEIERQMSEGLGAKNQEMTKDQARAFCTKVLKAPVAVIVGGIDWDAVSPGWGDPDVDLFAARSQWQQPASPGRSHPLLPRSEWSDPEGLERQPYIVFGSTSMLTPVVCIHECAHLILMRQGESYQDQRQAHGGSWRSLFASLMEEHLGVNPYASVGMAGVTVASKPDPDSIVEKDGYVTYAYKEYETYCEVTAHDGSLEVGTLWWEKDTGVIEAVETHPAYRREGIATKMLEIARRSYAKPITHSRTLTPDGKAWSERVGVKTAGGSAAAWAEMGFGSVSARPQMDHPERYNAKGLLPGMTETKLRENIGGLPTFYDVAAIPESDLKGFANILKVVETYGKPIPLMKGWDSRGWPLYEVPGSERPITHVYRVVSLEDWENIQRTKVIQSDGRMNLGAEEGTVASVIPTGEFYKAKDGPSVILKIKVNPADGWRQDHDGYIKTRKPIPLSRVERTARFGSIRPTAQKVGDERAFGRFTMRYTTKDTGGAKPQHVITTYGDGIEVGSMVWHGRTHGVISTDVKLNYRRLGIATAMWEWSQEMRPKAKHSTDRTDDGDAWARSVGGPLPRRNTAALTLPVYYHGSPHELPIGTVLVPGGPEGKSEWGTDGLMGVWVTSDLVIAHQFMGAAPEMHRFNPKGHIYEVEPIGEVMPHRRDRNPRRGYCPSARIVAEVDPETGMRKSAVIAKRKEIWEMTPAEFASKQWVYHGTRRQDDLEKLLRDGVKISNVPMNLNRRRFQSGDIEDIFFQPGAGVGMGLYVGDFNQAQQFGDCVVAIEVDDDDLSLPPESADYADYFADPIGKALKDANGALIAHDIPASRVYLVAERFARYERDPMEMSRNNAEGINKKSSGYRPTDQGGRDERVGSDPGDRGGSAVRDRGRPHEGARSVGPGSPDGDGHGAVARGDGQPRPSLAASKATYYHGSRFALPPGTILVPGGEEGPKSDEDGDQYVWITRVIDVADIHASVDGSYNYIGGGHVYEVEPLGGVQDRSEAKRPNQQFRTPRARIIREVPRPEVESLLGKTASASGLLWHASPVKLPEGTVLVPSGPEGPQSRTGPVTPGREDDKNWVWMTREAKDAYGFALKLSIRGKQPYLYLVRPTSPVEERSYDWHPTPVTQSAKVVARYPYETGSFDGDRSAHFNTPFEVDGKTVWGMDGRMALWKQATEHGTKFTASVDPTLDSSFGSLRERKTIDGITYAFRTRSDGPFNTGAFVTATANGQKVGHINIGWQAFSPTGFVIQWVEVDTEHQRKGIAAHMLEIARSHLAPWGGVRHDTTLSPSGRPWAEKVGSSKSACRYGHPERIKQAERLLEQAKDQPKESRREHMRSIANGALRNIRHAMQTCPDCSDAPAMLAMRYHADYRGGHQPSEGPPAYDLLDESGDFSLPSDIYDKPQWYTGFTEREYLDETMRALRSVRGKPEAKVRIYRALPEGHLSIDKGNWISLSLAYAKGHAMQGEDESEDWPVISAEVPAKYVRHAGDDLMEFGYWGPDLHATKVASIERTSALAEGTERTFKDYRLVYVKLDMGERKPRHQISAYSGGKVVGALNWYGTTGMVHSIDVDAAHRRKGLASAMWEMSQEVRPKAKHSADRTHDGDAWARSVGGTLPRRNTAALHMVHRDRGKYGRRDHMTYEEQGTIPIEVVRDMPGWSGEVPHTHRNRKGERWEEFKADLAENGMHYGIFIMVNVGEPIRIWEGNHRRDAAVELGWDEIPVQIRYTGLAEQDGTLMERYARGGNWMDGYKDTERIEREEAERKQRWGVRAVASTEPKIRLYHGTNHAAAEAIRRSGEFRAISPEETAHEVERRYDLPHNSVWQSKFNDFSRGRSLDPLVYLSGNRETAADYARIGGEVLFDALTAAYYEIHGEESTVDRQQWVRDETAKHYEPVVLTLDVPFDAFAKAQAEQWRRAKPVDGHEVGTYEWWMAITDGEPGNTETIKAPFPASWIVNEQKVSSLVRTASQEIGGIKARAARAVPEVVEREWIFKALHGIESDKPPAMLQNVLRRVLRTEGVEGASFAVVRTSQQAGGSHIGVDLNPLADEDEPWIVPVVYLHPRMHDMVTLLHEAAHLIDLYREGHLHDANLHNEGEVHGARFEAIFEGLLRDFYGKGLPRIASRTVKPLPMGPGIFYRLQGEKPFEADPTSTVSREHISYEEAERAFGKDHAERYFTPQKGYSAFPNPEHVRQYVEEMGWDEGKVVAFRGAIIGSGFDDEPLVKPEGGVIETIEWEDFTDRIEITPGATHYPDWSSNADGGGRDYEIPGQGPRFFTLGGPGSGVIPDRVRADAPGNPRAPRPVVVNRTAESDIRDLPDGDEKIVRQMLKRIERGEVELERKHRYPLQDCFTADASRSLRIALFPHIDGSWQVFYVGYHDYDEAERRMASNEVPASTPIRRSKVRNIDTDRLSRRREFLRSLIKDRAGELENRIDFVWRAAELHAIETELESRGELPDERITLASLQATAALDVDGMEVLMDAIENSTPVEVLYHHSPGYAMTVKGVPVGGGRGVLNLSDWPERDIAWDDIISVRPAVPAKAAAMDDAGRAYVAEGVIERMGKQGPIMDEEEIRALGQEFGIHPNQMHLIPPSSMKVHHASPDDHGFVSAMGTVFINAQYATRLTVLHEIAHWLVRHEGHFNEGHGPIWQRKAADLYRSHLDPEAADRFESLMGLTAEANREMVGAGS